MKKITLFTFVMLSVISVAFSQVPASFNYQAVVRNSSGEIIANKTVSFRISLLKDSESGKVLYSETHKLATNEFGLVNLKIGKGTKLSGKFSPSGWGEVIFTKIEFDPKGGSSFSELVTTKLSSVPYAFIAQSVVNDKVDDADADPKNEIQTLKLTGNLLELSNGGGEVTLPSSGGGGGGDNWGAQVVKTDATLTGNGTSTKPLHVVPDGDSDDTNELQTLSLSGNDLSLSDGGGTVTLPGSSSPWLTNDKGIYCNTDHVGVGVEPDNVVMLSVQAPSRIIPLGVYSYGDDPAIYANNYSTGSAAWFDGAVKISDGTQGAGKVLTSDANGLASWQTPATGGSSLWTEYGSSIYRASGKVGIGRKPYYNLDVYNASGDVNACIKSKSSDAELVIEKANASDYASITYASYTATGENLFFVGLLGDDNYRIKSQSASCIQVANSGNVTMYHNLMVEGKVGIGTTYPAERLEVNGNIKVDGNISLSSSGKIGVGTSTPSAPLEIKSNEINALIIGSATANYNQRPGIQFKNNTSQFIAGDDGSDEVFGFYSKWGNTRKYDAKLRVYGNSTSSWGKYIQLTHDGTNGFISTDTGNLDLTPSGKVGIKTNSPTATLDVNGTVRFRGITSGSQTTAIVIDSNGNLHSNSSDRRLKENIHSLKNGLNKVLKLRGVTFTWKANPEYGTRIGFIAQEFEKVVPELAFTNPVDGYKGVNYAEVTAVLVEAIKEQQKIIEAMKTENNQLKADNDQIVSRLEKLESLLSVSAQK